MSKFFEITKTYVWPRLVLDLVTFYPPLVILGIIAAELEVNIEVLIGVFVNFLLLVFSFMYNDIADRKDDEGVPYSALPVKNHIALSLGMYKKEGTKRFKNPFAWGSLSITSGYLILSFVAILSLVLSYVAGGVAVLLVAGANLVLGIFYSGGIIRLKAHPFVDVISHAFLLGFVQVFYFLAYENAVISSWSALILLGSTVMAAASSLENQYRDFNEDMAASLDNTASVIGRNASRVVRLFLHAGGLLLVVAGVAGILL